MSTPTQTVFDFEALRRAFESWDVDALLELYDDEVEVKQIDKETPPASPRILRGKPALAEFYRDVAGRGLETRVEDAIDAGSRLALALRCRYPSGECVYGHALLDVRDGKIVRQVDVQAWDE